MGGQLGTLRKTEDVWCFTLITRFRFCSIFDYLYAAGGYFPQLQSQGVYCLLDLGMESSRLEWRELLRRGVWQKVSVRTILTPYALAHASFAPQV